MVGRLEQRGQRHLLAESPLDPGEQVDGQERRPAQVEEVVADPHRLDPQQVGPDPGDRRLDLGAGRHGRRAVGGPGPMAARSGADRLEDLLRVRQLGGDPLEPLRLAAGLGAGARRLDGLRGVAHGLVSGRDRRLRPIGDARGRLRRDLVPQAPLDLPAVGRRHRLEEVAGRLVLLGEEHRRVDPREPAGPGDLPQLAQHAVLDAPAQHPAAQEERVDLQGLAAGAEDHRADQAVVAEPVAHLHRPAFQPRLAQPADLGVVAPDRAEVELVGPLRELRHALDLLGGGLGDRDLQPQPRQELVDGRRLLLESRPLGFLPVHRRPLPVLGRDPGPVERPDVPEEPLDVAVDRQPERQDLRAGRADLGALDRVVVQEDEAVQPEVQLPRQRADVLRFRLPVDPPGDQVLALQDHVRPAVEDLQHVGLDVLAAQADQEPLARPLRHEPLEALPGRRDGDAVDPLLADDPLPERVVAVEDDDLVGRGQHRVDPAGQQRAHRGEERGRVGDVAQPVAPRVVVVGDRIELEVARGDHRDAGHAGQLVGDPGGGPVEMLATVAGGAGLGRVGAEGDDQGGPRSRRHPPRRVDQVARVPLQGFPDPRPAARARAGERPQPVLGPDQHHVNPRPVLRQQAGRVEQLLEDLVVGREFDRRRQLQLAHPEVQGVLHRLGREGGRHGDPAAGRPGCEACVISAVLMLNGALMVPPAAVRAAEFVNESD